MGNSWIKMASQYEKAIYIIMYGIVNSIIMQIISQIYIKCVNGIISGIVSRIVSRIIFCISIHLKYINVFYGNAIQFIFSKN